MKTSGNPYDALDAPKAIHREDEYYKDGSSKTYTSGNVTYSKGRKDKTNDPSEMKTCPTCRSAMFYDLDKRHWLCPKGPHMGREASRIEINCERCFQDLAIIYYDSGRYKVADLDTGEFHECPKRDFN